LLLTSLPSAAQVCNVFASLQLVAPGTQLSMQVPLSHPFGHCTVCSPLPSELQRINALSSTQSLKLPGAQTLHAAIAPLLLQPSAQL
jgi:hypothetical protein